MLVAELLERLGGVAQASALTPLVTAHALSVAVERGEVRRVARGRYALPAADLGLRAAAALAGHASHLSAATIHGWEIARSPDKPQTVVPRNRKVASTRRRWVEVRYRDLGPHEGHEFVTSPVRTVIDCARDLPFADALAVADSALRHGLDADHLVDRAVALPGRGRQRALRVVSHATPLAANPFESVLRAIALGVPGLHVEPQVHIDDSGFSGRPDLVDEKRRLVIEADSHEFHASTRRQHNRDCARYNALVVRGWRVLRFTWEQVMFDAEYVRDVLLTAVETPGRRAMVSRSGDRTA